ncbi:MAG TPA: glycosyltransferase family 39 protein [Mucilaginibacter sp.]|nr:glycosyltransferase family 39 protein [Mucilaginibacter sp.]
MNDKNKPIYLLLFILALVVNFAGINVKFFTDDPGLYASISKNLIYRKEFFELFTYNQDWLDKPHFPFWMVMFSFKLFGINVWAYRLPALLFFLLSLLYTWLFTKKHYGQEIACIAVLILATSQHLIMSNTDVRAEPYLMALVIGSIYYISRLEERFTFRDLLLAALLAACAIMTKGIFVIVAIYGALLGQLIFQNKFRQLFQLKWIALFLLTLIFTFPELYALYIQFDLHPEKLVFHRHNVSGIKWFLWDSQFGRFVNNGPITRQSGSIFFYMHTLLWAFAPWCLLFYYAIYKNIREIISKRKLAEYYTISGGLLLLLLFSLSRFQLPFYTNTIFPLFAIITASFCYKQLSHAGAIYRQASLWLYIAAFPIAILVMHYLLKPADITFFVIDCLLFGATAIIIFTKIKTPYLKAFCLTCTAALFANFYLNTVFYKEWGDYKGQIKAADYINQPAFNNYHIYTVRQENNIFQFYSKKQIDFIPIHSFKDFKPTGPSAFYVNRLSLDSIILDHADFKLIKAFQNYPQEIILPAFINKNTRNKVLDSIYLITK